jgi:hypothetical protein
MASGRTEAQEGLGQRGEHRAGIASELGAEVLRPVEDARLLEEIDAAIDLSHVLVGYREICAPENIAASLRWHYPDQLEGPKACRLASQPRQYGAPLSNGSALSLTSGPGKGDYEGPSPGALLEVFNVKCSEKNRAHLFNEAFVVFSYGEPLDL